MRISIGPLVAGRECGSCTACCTVLKIDGPDLQKPPGIPCEHSLGGGCDIHPTRPTGCRTWFCLWREHPAVPHAARPDLSGVMVTLETVPEPETPFDRRFFILRASHAEGDLKGPWARDLLAFCSQGRVPVFLGEAGERMLAYPPRPLARMIVGREAVGDADAQEVTAWREALKIDVDRLAEIAERCVDLADP